METTGRAKGVVLGGKLEILQERVMVRCLPTVIPDSIVVEVTNLEIGGKVMADQLPLPEGVKAVFDRDFPVIAIQTARGAKTGEEE